MGFYSECTQKCAGGYPEFTGLNVAMPYEVMSEERKLLASKPKKPPSAYVCFLKEVRKKVATENPEFGLSDVTSTIAKMWGNLSTSNRRPYDHMAYSHRTAWMKDIAEWKQKWVDLDAIKAALQELHERAFNERAVEFYKAHLGMTEDTSLPPTTNPTSLSPTPNQKSKPKYNANSSAKSKSTGLPLELPPKPRRGKTSFLYFSGQRRPQLQELYPIVSSRDISAMLGQEWREMSKDNKVLYKVMADSDTKRYRVDMDAWEKMRAVYVTAEDDERRAMDTYRLEKAVAMVEDRMNDIKSEKIGSITVSMSDSFENRSKQIKQRMFQTKR